jgi:hypothetical protein
MQRSFNLEAYDQAFGSDGQFPIATIGINIANNAQFLETYHRLN